MNLRITHVMYAFILTIDFTVKARAKHDRF
jgi:hypothetical protein